MPTEIKSERAKRKANIQKLRGQGFKREAICHALYASKGLGWKANPWVWVYGFEPTDG